MTPNRFRLELLDPSLAVGGIIRSSRRLSVNYVGGLIRTFELQQIGASLKVAEFTKYYNLLTFVLDFLQLLQEPRRVSGECFSDLFQPFNSSSATI